MSGLITWTKQLQEDTHYAPTGEMERDSIGFNQADVASARDYLAVAEATGGDVPIGTHILWAESIRKYGDTQLGGKDRVDRFIANLRRVALERGEPIPEKIPRVNDKPKGASGAYFKIDKLTVWDADEPRVVGVIKPPRGAPGWAKVNLQQAEIPLEVANFMKHNGEWIIYVNDPGKIAEVTRKIAAAYPDVATWQRLAARATDAEPLHERIAAKVRPPPKPVVEHDRAPEDPNLIVLGRNHAIKVEDAQPDCFFMTTPYGYSIGGQELFRALPVPRARAFGPPARASEEAIPSRGKPIFWWVYDRKDAAKLEAFLRPEDPRTADAIRALATRWAASTPAPAPMSLEDRLYAETLITRYRHLMDEQIRNDPAKMRELVPQMVEVLNKLKDIEPFQREVDLGPYGKWRLTQFKRQRALDLEVPRVFDWQRSGPMNPTTGERFNLKDLGYMGFAKGPRGWEVYGFLKYVGAIAQAMEASGNLPMAIALRLAFLTDEATRSADIRLEQLTAAPSTSDIEDPKLRAEVDGIGDKIDALLEPGYKLRPYQRVGPAFWYFRGQTPGAIGMRAYIGDAPGVGKTTQGIAGLLLEHVFPTLQTTPALVVAPLSTLTNWKMEIQRFAGRRLNPIVVHSTGTQRELPRRVNRGDVVIVSSAFISRHLQRLLVLGFRSVIFDEAHYFKNISAARTKAAIALSQIPNVLMLSGTPIDNKPENIWSQLHALDATLYPSFRQFRERFSDPEKRTMRDDEGNEFKIHVPGAGDAGAELRDVLRSIMVRRFQKDVAAEMPPKVRKMEYVELSGRARKAYAAAEKRFESWLCDNFIRRTSDDAAARIERAIAERKREVGRMTERDINGLVTASLDTAVRWANDQRAGGDGGKLTEINALRQATGVLKVPAAVQFIEDYLEDNRGNPLIVFAEHRDVTDALMQSIARIKPAVRVARVDGSTPQNKRAEAFAAVNAGQLDVLVATRAINEGVNLQGASNILFVERWWKPADEEQAENRAWRSGQTNTVMIHYLTALDTMDEYMADVVNQKRETIGAIIGTEREAIRGGAATQVLARLGLAWSAFAYKHKQAIADLLPEDHGDVNIVTTGEDTSVGQAVMAAMATKLQRSGACVVTGQHIIEALNARGKLAKYVGR